MNTDKKNAVFVAAALLLCVTAVAQITPTVKFEVLSIRPVQSGASPYDSPTSFNFGPTPSGFTSRLTVWQAIMIAYAPGGSLTWATTQVLNTPNWNSEFFDFNARVSQADLKAWQNQSSDHELLRSAMRAALKERFNLAIHEQPSTGKIYELVVGKGGPRLKAATPDETLPVGAKLPSGGVGVGKQLADRKTEWDYHGATMQDLAWFLTIASRGVPVHDRTGLTGRYDFTFREVEISPDDEPVYRWPVDDLGLKVKSGTESRPVLVIDHIERPMAN